ncbi:MAG: UDP-N-acetylglucosamine 2-epimerase [Candidatus Omnitrophica bacterium]|nr:UDP-N-acetylglucosamine 2-epimerase [Candidatus Omnitrophota bacterium]
MAIEKALRYLDPDIQVYNINSFNYTNPILEKVINRTYTGVIKRTPEVWEYLYDNPKIVKNTQRLKDMIHRFNSSKMRTLIEDFRPDAIACTQAFPCGMVADYKVTYGSDVPLVGVLTDFYPHSYWVYEAVNRYAVASDEARLKLLQDGVSPEKVAVFGIPIDAAFKISLDKDKSLERLGLDKDAKTILIMGGSTGLGPIKRIVATLDRIGPKIQMVIVTGTNTKLQGYLNRRVKNFKNKIQVIGYADNMNELMTASDMIITKPGGLTVSEAMAKGLPMIIINPIPGQEAKNTQFLLQQKVAVKADNEEDLAILVENLCYNPSKLEAMRAAASAIGKPESAYNIAKMILEL